MEGVFFILIFIGVIAITAVLFTIWVVVGIMRLGVRLLGALFAPPQRPTMPPIRALSSIGCGNSMCNAINPSNARFCRRCGQALEPRRVAARRVACW